MELQNSQYHAIMRQYEQERQKNRHILEDRYQQVCAAIPRYRDLDLSLPDMSVACAKKILDGADKEVTLANLKEQVQQIEHEKKELLASAGFPADFLQPIFTCEKCHDTGRVDGHRCQCMEKAILKMLHPQSNLDEILEKENFQTFSFDYYPDDDVLADPQTGDTPRKSITEAHRVCREFADHFPAKYKNLFLYGKVGVGKTFLTNCIAKELIDKGYSVIYLSACTLFHKFSQNTFDRQDTDAKIFNDYIFHCDLLIIDDLGSEYITQFTVSQFFNCINERLLCSRPTIISTNLSLAELENLYTERVFSRISGSYKLLHLIGSDIRIQKHFLSSS